jgi:putative effector of murein hydrolase
MPLTKKPTVLSRPFFEDKSRAFWTLQAAGWTGYLILRGVSSVSNASELSVIIPVVIESIVGYSITLLLSTLYQMYRRQPRLAMALLTIVTLAVATLLYSVLDATSPCSPAGLRCISGSTST